MQKNLLGLTATELLAKFGKGSHKPGSGSASAFQAMLSAQMSNTVIEITLRPSNEGKYASAIGALRNYQNSIDKLYPRLEHLFQNDADVFDQVIRTRNERDQEKDKKSKRALLLKSRELLKLATEIPLEIAELAYELGVIASYVFDNGFRPARGDSGVALQSAISAMSSCLAIIELNLITIPYDQWVEKVSIRKHELSEKLNELGLLGGEKLEKLKAEVDANIAFEKTMAKFRQGGLATSTTRSVDIEQIVRDFQNTLWENRAHIWKTNTPQYHIEILKPATVLEKALNYLCIESDNMDKFEAGGRWYEAAGLIDPATKEVHVSKKLSTEVTNFTWAHELGHAVLHSGMLLHRDGPIDHNSPVQRDPLEMQADKFASSFLMPAKILKETFEEIFGSGQLLNDEFTAYGLRFRNETEARLGFSSTRAFSRMIAKADFFNGRPFNSLAKIFAVSEEAMAIRLEELNLVSYTTR